MKQTIDSTNSRASSLVSPCENTCPNCESANSCKPPDDDILKYPQTFCRLRKFNSSIPPELGLKP
jgi:hypothetical protein